jgi:hypothetical protein
VAPFREDQNIIAVTLTGEIVKDDEVKFQNAFWRGIERSKGHQGVILELVSSGGDTYASEAISRFIHSQGIATLVRGDCTSGCGIIALSARSLWVAAGGRVGLHQAWLTGEKGMAVGHMGATQEVADLLKSYGVPRSVLARMLRTGPYDMAFLTDKELTDCGAHINRNVLRASQ